MALTPTQHLKRLEAIRHLFGEGLGPEKVSLIDRLNRRRLPDAASLARLHESLCFLRAIHDDQQVHDAALAALERFSRRADLRRHRGELEDSGIAGTDIRFSFYWEMARWLARNWPDQLSVEWSEHERAERLEGWLSLLVSSGEAPALDERDDPARDWVDRLRGPDESDAAFLIRRFERIRVDDGWRERLFEELETPFLLRTGEGTPSRSLAWMPDTPRIDQRRPLDRKRPDLIRATEETPRSIRRLGPAPARRVIALAREAMVTRSRDLDVFANADPRDVRLVDFGEGLQFACIGVKPERRLLLEAVYGFLTLKNGVPIGYVLCSALFGSSEVAYNIFETWRGAESARTYGKILAMIRHLFGSDAFCVDPYQLGHQNDEGLRSGAWWFYYKLGFRPKDPDVRRVLRGELRKMKANPAHRSSLDTLRRLVPANVYFHLGAAREDVMGEFFPGAVSMRVVESMAARFGGDREGGERTCIAEAGRLLGVRSTRGWSSGERLAWRRWAPLVTLLPGLRRWSPATRRALAKVIRAKGGRAEDRFVALFNAHRPLRRALLKLAAEADAV